MHIQSDAKSISPFAISVFKNPRNSSCILKTIDNKTNNRTHRVSKSFIVHNMDFILTVNYFIS